MSDTKILDDIIPEENGVKGEPLMHINTLWDYLGCLDDIYVTGDLEAWTLKLRSKTVVKTALTRHLSDPTIIAYFLGPPRRIFCTIRRSWASCSNPWS